MTTGGISSVRTAPEHLVEVRNLNKWFASREGTLLGSLFGADRYLKAVDDVSFAIRRGEILGLAGQSGCGKSTLGELLVRLQDPTDGTIAFDGEDITTYGRTERKRFTRRAQVIFQDPYESMNPRFPVSRTVSEPLKIHGIGDSEERHERTVAALADAGLRPPEQFLDSLPDELSGGERQRVAIARALVLEPEFIVADEPVSMLDVSVRTGILKLFKRLQQDRGISILYISHDLSTINYLADRTMIMYLGNVVELGETEDVIHNPAHPYTDALLKSVPDPDPDHVRPGAEIGGDVPDSIDLPTGCRFHPRCDFASARCRETEPALDVPADAGGSDRSVACHHPVHE